MTSPHILNGLRRAMISSSGDWDMFFCAGGKEALALMAQESFDVIVSDMRMPEMDGAQLLEIVRKRHPAAIRIILSGYADAASVLRTVGPAHAYLAKPCESHALAGAIARPLALRRMLNSESLHRAVGGLTNLPSLPDLYLQIEAALNSPNASIRAVADIIGRDIAMTAEILKLTNSAFFSVGARVATPLQAVRTLGLETVQALILRIGIFRQFSGGEADGMAMFNALTAYSLVIARMAETIALAEGADVATGKAAYCAGMLCCLGMVMLLDAKPTEYRRILAAVGDKQPPGQIGRSGLRRQSRPGWRLSAWALGLFPALAGSDRPVGPSDPDRARGKYPADRPACRPRFRSAPALAAAGAARR